MVTKICTALVSIEEGRYLARLAELPGVITEGDSFQEAMHNLHEAAQGVIESYHENFSRIPWMQSLPSSGETPYQLTLHVSECADGTIVARVTEAEPERASQ